MNHQPYESWILDEEKRTKQQQLELEDHLLLCPSCKTLQESWEAAKHQIKDIPAKQPSPGFSMRWQAGLKERKEAEERKQSRTLFIWIGCLIAAVVVSLAVIYLPKLSLIGVMISFVTTLVSISSGVNDFLQLIGSLIRSLPPTALILAAVSLSTLISGVCFVWGVSIWRMSRKGVKQNEEN